MVGDTSSRGLEDIHEPETGSAPHQSADRVPAGLQSSMCSTRSKASFAYGSVREASVKDTKRFMRNITTFKAHGHTSGFDPVSFF